MKPLFSLLLLFYVFTLHGQVSWQWTDSWNASIFSAVVSGDTEGNVYVAGEFNNDSLNVGDHVLYSQGEVFVYLIKYDSTGHAEWARKMGPGWVTSTLGNRLIDVDLNSNVVLLIRNQQSTLSYHDSVIPVPAGTEMTLLKVDPNGELLFAKPLSTSQVYPNYLVVDNTDHILIGGRYYDTLLTIDTINISASQGSHTFLTRLDHAGNAEWVKASHVVTGNEATAVAVDDMNNIYLAGNSYGVLDLDTIINFNYSRNIYLVKLDSSGTFSWIRSAGANNRENFIRSMIYRNGKINVAGNLRDTLFFSNGPLTINSFSTDLSDILLFQYDTSGILTFKSSYGGIEGDYATAISYDALNNIYVAGAFRSDTLSIGGSNLYAHANTGSNIFISKLTEAGNPLWAYSTGTLSNYTNANSLYWNAFNKLYVAGRFDMDTLFFPPYIVHEGSNFVACLYDNITSVDQFSMLPGIHVMPNPAGSFIRVNAEDEFISAEITDISGRRQVKFNYHANKPIDISMLKPGLYILSLIGRNSTHSLKFVKSAE